MKKVLSLVLVAVLALGMGVTAFAAGNVVEFASDADYLGANRSTSMPSSYKLSGTDDNLIVDETVRPIDELEITLALDPALFKDEDGAAPTSVNSDGNLSKSLIKSSKIKVRSQVKKGSAAIDEVKLDEGKGIVEIVFNDEYVATKDLDFEVFVYLTIDGTSFRDNGVTVSGTYENEVDDDVDADYEWYDLSDQMVIEAQEYVRNIELELGDDVSVFTNLYSGRKYYGTATTEVTEADDEVMKQYPGVSLVYTLNTVGLNTASSQVKLGGIGSDYFVYDSNMAYLGKSNEMLGYSNKYYLSTTELEVAGSEEEEELPEEEEEDPEDEGEVENPGSGGDGEAAPNVNANPGTGR